MGKETVLALLLREKGHFVSGEAVSAELGITRAAIWKSISALRAQGYEIDAVTGRGYCLKSLPDTLTEQTVRSYLGPVETVGKRIDCFRARRARAFTCRSCCVRSLRRRS